MRKKFSSLAVLIGLAVGLTGCGIGNDTDGRLDLVAGFYPMAYISEHVGAEFVDVTTLAPPNTEPHDLELTQKQLTRVADAELAVYLDGFQPSLDEAVSSHNKDRGFDAAAVAPLLDGYTPATPVSPATPATSKPDRNDPIDTERNTLAEDGKGKDPHVWLSPIRLADVVQGLAKRFSEIEPIDGKKFNRNAAKLRGRLQALDIEIAAGLENCQSRTIVVSHNAFGYFAERYNLQQIAITGLSPAVEPSQKRLAEVSRIAKLSNVNTVFTEPLVNPQAAETVAAQIGATTATLDPVAVKPSSGDYFDQMRANTQTLRTALRCS
ncbi:MAG: metal ABC transporter substrate-binding protein [Mycobacteriales bacterium]